ncbi:c-type cytochrome [Halomonas shantousis]
MVLGLVTMGLRQPANAEDAESLFRQKACSSCHAIDTPVVGPSFRSVASRYAGQDDATATLMHSILNGSQSKWGPVPMVPNRVSEEQARILAEWILEQQ